MGKFTPFLAGYTGRNFPTLLIIWLGDLLYESTFFFSSLIAGRVFLKFSKILGIVLFAVVILVYLLWKRRISKDIVRHRE